MLGLLPASAFLYLSALTLRVDPNRHRREIGIQSHPSANVPVPIQPARIHPLASSQPCRLRPGSAR